MVKNIRRFRKMKSDLQREKTQKRKEYMLMKLPTSAGHAFLTFDRSGNINIYYTAQQIRPNLGDNYVRAYLNKRLSILFSLFDMD